MEQILEIALGNQKRAYGIIEELRIPYVWDSVGGEARLVGSLKTGLLAKHKDIDFHIYSPVVTVKGSFAAITEFARSPHIVKIEFANMLQTEEECLEWHLYYRDGDSADLWQIDMIHIVKGSMYDGFFERVAERISATLTPETKEAIIRLKFQTPDDTKIMGIEYCRAVIEGGVRNYDELSEWRKQNPFTGIETWMP